MLNETWSSASVHVLPPQPIILLCVILTINWTSMLACLQVNFVLFLCISVSNTSVGWNVCNFSTTSLLWLTLLCQKIIVLCFVDLWLALPSLLPLSVQLRKFLSVCVTWIICTMFMWLFSYLCLFSFF